MVLVRNKKVLDSVNVRPTLVGKKTVGNLEVHSNGFRFNANNNKGYIEFTFKNIKHAIFQPCENDLIVILHFRLKSPI